MPRPIIVWFRDDLRLADNPALAEAAGHGAPILPVYVFDEESEGLRPLGGASRWWLHHSLAALGADLAARGAPLLLLRGAAEPAVLRLAEVVDAGAVHWNRRYGRAERTIDQAIKAGLQAKGVAAESFSASLLHEPWTVKSKAGGPFKVFGPFWRAAQAGGEPAPPAPAPARIEGLGAGTASGLGGIALSDLALLPRHPDWSGGLAETWTPGEAGAKARLASFLSDAFGHYADGRDRPDQAATTALSPSLRFGEIGPRQVWQACAFAVHGGTTRGTGLDLAKLQSELGWREFSYHLLFHHPDLATQSFQPRFEAFPWRQDPARLEAWRRGMTGYPLVDAGMRQLWTTGWMHNRVRMITASFVIKHLLVDWREGERWFWDTLVDADPANNAASWQWVAGSGADAAPYYRIFNPVAQGERFDPDGTYVKRWVPELARLPAKLVHRPWDASSDTLAAAGIRLGETYPRPVVDHGEARIRALSALESLKPAGR
jgi:deoxyribodipyrimidine photo-lyase